MAELVRGLISDRPWGLTFAQIALREVTGQLTVNASDGRLYRVAFEGGAIVGALSPQPADSAIRIALTSNLIMSSQVSWISRALTERPGDDVVAVSTVCKLDEAKTRLLRRNTILQRAARTFAIEQGAFLLDEEITIPTSSDNPIDARVVIYQGARMNLSEKRLVGELHTLGSHFTLDAAFDREERFGLAVADRPILDSLRGGTTLAELEERHRDLDPRNMQSVIYALLAFRDVTAGAPAMGRAPTLGSLATGSRPGMPPVRPSPPTDSPVRMKPSTTSPAVARTRTPPSTTSPAVARTRTPPSTAPMTARTRTPSTTSPAVARTRTPSPSVARTVTPRPGSMPPPNASRTSTGSTPPPNAARGTGSVPQTNVARTRSGSMPPTRPQTGSVPPLTVSRTTSQSGVQFAVPRTVSQSSMGVPNSRMYSEGTDRVRDSLTEAAESYQRGQEALRTKQLIEAIAHLTRAVKLDPHVFEYAALLAWAQYLGAPSSERKQTTEKVRKLLNHAIQKSSDPERARFHLGELEKMLGRDAEALALFKVVAKANPDHVEALAEVQELEAKLANKSSSSGGWFRKR